MLIQFVKRFIDGTPSVAEPVSTDNPLPVTMVGGGASGPQEVTAPAIGTPTDTAAAANGTGDITIVGALRRGLLNWAALFERLPALVSGRVPVESTTPASDARGSGTREYNQASISRSAVGATSTRFEVGSLLAASREAALCSNVRLFYRTGDSNVAVTAGTGLVLPIDQMHHFRIPAGHTHIAIIGDGGTGFVTFVAVAS